MSVLSSGTQWDAAGQISSCDSSCSWQSCFSVKNHGVEPNVGCISTDRPMATSTHLGSSSCDHWDGRTWNPSIASCCLYFATITSSQESGALAWRGSAHNLLTQREISQYHGIVLQHMIFVITILMIMLVRWPRNWWGEWKNVLFFVHKLDSRNWRSDNNGRNVCDQRPSWPLSCAQ